MFSLRRMYLHWHLLDKSKKETWIALSVAIFVNLIIAAGFVIVGHSFYKLFIAGQ